MKEMLVKSQYINSEIEMARTRQKERTEINKAVPPLRKRLGKIIRENVAFPNKIKGDRYPI